MILQNLNPISKDMGYAIAFFAEESRREFSSGINSHQKALNFQTELNPEFHPIIDEIRKAYNISNIPRHPTVFLIKDLEFALKGYYSKGTKIVIVLISKDLKSFEEYKNFESRDSLDLYLNALQRV